MIAEHVSHFGLDMVDQGEAYITFKGTLGACKRMMAAHGVEVREYQGGEVVEDARFCLYAKGTPDDFCRAWYEDGSLIERQGATWALAMSRETWAKS